MLDIKKLERLKCERDFSLLKAYHIHGIPEGGTPKRYGEGYLSKNGFANRVRTFEGIFCVENMEFCTYKCEEFVSQFLNPTGN